MAYKVFVGPRGADAISPLEKEHALFKEFDDLDQSLAFAHAMQKRGGGALLIEGDDGTRLDKQQIATALKHRESEIADKPAAYANKPAA